MDKEREQYSNKRKLGQNKRKQEISELKTKTMNDNKYVVYTKL